jgi:hypothetical protein
VHDLTLKEALSITKYGSRFNIETKLWGDLFWLFSNQLTTWQIINPPDFETVLSFLFSSFDI